MIKATLISEPEIAAKNRDDVIVKAGDVVDVTDFLYAKHLPLTGDYEYGVLISTDPTRSTTITYWGETRPKVIKGKHWIPYKHIQFNSGELKFGPFPAKAAIYSGAITNICKWSRVPTSETGYFENESGGMFYARRIEFVPPDPIKSSRPTLNIAIKVAEKPKMFWMVSSSFGPPKVRHASKEVAECEAQRLANKHRGSQFYVLETISMFVENAPEKPPYTKQVVADDDIPF